MCVYIVMLILGFGYSTSLIVPCCVDIQPLHNPTLNLSSLLQPVR